MAITGLAQVRHTVVQLTSSASEEQLQAVLALRELCLDGTGKGLIRESGGVEALVTMLHQTDDSCATIAVEALACLAVDDVLSRERMHRAGAPQKLVGLLKGLPNAETAQRALLALRIMSDKETDRLAIMQAGGVDVLVHLLRSGPLSESAEFATAVLGNLAAGSQGIKDKIREAGAIEPLVQLLQDAPGEIAAELGAVVLRNLAAGNEASRQAIVDAGGLWPLLSLLAMGQERLVYPMPCQVTYLARDVPGGAAAQKVILSGQCCFDTIKGHLCVATEASTKVLACVMPPRQLSPRASTAERYSLMRKLTVTEPETDTLEISFDMLGKEGADKLARAGGRKPKAARRLQQVSISPCAATELKGAVMRLLTKLHLELEFWAYISGNSIQCQRVVTR